MYDENNLQKIVSTDSGAGVAAALLDAEVISLRINLKYSWQIDNNDRV